MRRLLRVTTLAVPLVTILSGQGHADVTLSGPDSNAGTYSTSQLAGVANGADTFTADGFTGISLWGLLGGANASMSTPAIYGSITTSTPDGDNGKNAILRYYLLATGSSGVASVISLGEIDPNFGGTAIPPAFVAYQTSGGSALATPSLIVPGAAGRDVTNLTSLQLLAAPALPQGPPNVISNSVALTGAVANPGNYTLADLQNDFTPTHETVGGDNYTGVPLWTFLNSTDPNITDDYVVTAGTDGYEVVLSLAELDPSLGGNAGNLLPYADTTGDFPGDGVARTIFPGDNKHGRWESNLLSVDVVEAPEPGSMTLLASALLSLGLMRRKFFRPSARQASA